MSRLKIPVRGSHRAFTLIELLVVIAIIAILAAILFPVFAQARAKARQTACLSNMKQIGLAVIQYSSDYDGVIVPSQIGPTGSLLSWPTMIYPYVKSEGVFVCPSADASLFRPDSRINNSSNRDYTGTTDPSHDGSVASPPTTGDGSDVGFSKVPRLSYGRNLIVSNVGASTPPWSAVNSGRATTSGKTYSNFANNTDNIKSGFVGSGTTTEITESDIKDVAGTIHIMDAMTGGTLGTGTFGDALNLGNSIRGIQQDIRTDMYNDGTASKVAYRHNEGFVVLYGDGHSGWKKWGSSTPCQWTIQEDVCP